MPFTYKPTKSFRISLLKSVAFISLITLFIESKAQSQVTLEVGTPFITRAIRSVRHDNYSLGSYVHAGLTKRKVNAALRYYRSPFVRKGNSFNGFGVSMLKVHSFKNPQWFELQYGLSYLYIMEKYENRWIPDRNLNVLSAEVHANFYLYKNLYTSTKISHGTYWYQNEHRGKFRKGLYIPYFLSFGLGYTFK